MKDQYLHIDELYRKRFENFEPEPPEAVWNKISKELHKSGSGSGSTFRTFLLSILGFIIVGTAILFITNPFESSKALSSTHNVTYASNDFSLTITSDTDAESPVTSSEAADHNLNTPPPAEAYETPVTPATEQIDAVYETPVMQEPVALNTNEDIPAVFAESNPISNMTVSIAGITGKRNTGNDEIAFKNDIRFDDLTTYLREPVRPKSVWKAGFSVNPELAFYPNDTINNSRNYNFDFSISLHRSNFFIQTGIGLALARDEGRYMVDYESYDYMGTYQDLIGITFDSTEYGVVPVFHTKSVDVFDSVRHITIEKSTNTYTYFQMPLLFGFEKKTRRFAYFIKAGPSFSLLISKSIPGAQLPDDVNILDIDARVAERIKTNWQLLIGTGISYQLSNKVEVAIEPTLRYYLKSAYNRNFVSTKHPFAIGLRAGVVYRIK